MVCLGCFPRGLGRQPSRLVKRHLYVTQSQSEAAGPAGAEGDGAGSQAAQDDHKGEHVRRSHIVSAPPTYAWLLDVLLGGTPTVTWAATGELPAGFEFAEQLAVLPAAAGRSFLVSLKARRAASSALTSYNALRSPRRRLVRRVLGVGLRTGLVQPLLPGKIDVGTAVNATPEQLAGVLLSEHLRELFGRGPVAVAVSGGSGPYRKPVLQVFSTDGMPLGTSRWAGTTGRAMPSAVRPPPCAPAPTAARCSLACLRWWTITCGVGSSSW